MRRFVVRAAAAIGGLLVLAAPLHAQGYHVRWNTWFQSVAYRGVQADSILAATAVALPGGGFESPDGFAVSCPAGATYCGFFRPAAEQRGMPVVSTIDASVWGFGIEGLKLHVKGRAGGDLEDGGFWPGVEPEVQLIEGYAEYARRNVTVQAGRTTVFSRLGYLGLDGGQAWVRPLGGKLRIGAYGGWALAEGAVLPITSPELNPLAEFRPTERELAFGGSVGWNLGMFEGRLLYRREFDPGADLVSGERGAAEAVIHPGFGFTVTGGVEYDFLTKAWGTHDVVVRYRHPGGLADVTVGQRRYRPYFPVWSIWGVFSPAGYNREYASVAVYPVAGLVLRTEGYLFNFEDTETQTPLGAFEDGGWSWSAGGTYAGVQHFVFDANYRAQFGPGASSQGFDGRVTYRRDVFAVTARGGRLERPLEYRFSDAEVWSYGLRVDVEPMPGIFLNAEAVRYDETRERPDAAQLDWNQTRFSVGATFVFGSSGARSRGLHPAILRMPETRRSR